MLWELDVSQEMRNGKAGQREVAVCQMGYATDMIYAIDVSTDLIFRQQESA
jgi:hypothetical protein